MEGGLTACVVVLGAIGVAWCVMWIFLVYDRPSEHPRITPEERNYIETSQGPQRAKGVSRNGWMNGLVGGWLIGRIGGWMDVWVIGRMDE